MMDVQSGIYLITCIPTGKVYVGQSLDMKSRWGEHRSLLIRGKHDNGYLQRAWNKHGSDGFTFAILEEVEPGRLIEREAFHAERLRAFDRKRGFNLQPVEFTHSPEALAAIAERRRHEEWLIEIRCYMMGKLDEKNLTFDEFVQALLVFESSIRDLAEVIESWEMLTSQAREEILELIPLDFLRWRIPAGRGPSVMDQALARVAAEDGFKKPPGRV